MTKKDELRFNNVSNDKYGRSFWYFYTPEGDFLFALGCENQSDHFPLHPGPQGLLSDNLLSPSFHLRYRGRFLRVHYDANSDSLDIQGEKFDLQRGNLLLLRGEPGAFEIEQHIVTVNQEVFPEQEGSSRVMKEVDKVVPHGKRE